MAGRQILTLKTRGSIPPGAATVNRRNFLSLGLMAICAPAVVRASSLMPVRAFEDRFIILGDTFAYYPLSFNGVPEAILPTEGCVQSDYIALAIKSGDIFFVESHHRGGRVAAAIKYPQGAAQEALQEEMRLRLMES